MYSVFSQLSSINKNGIKICKSTKICNETEAVARMCSIKVVFLEISENS